MKTNPGKSAKSKKRKNMFKIKKAISRFISNTQKIVQKVKPEAKIVVQKKKPLKNPQKALPEASKTQEKPDKNKKVIQTPDFKGKL